MASERDHTSDSEPAAKTPRPAPQYGEYAPEGWSWSPEGDSAPTPAAGQTAAQPGQAAPPAGRRQLPGVPHNLGVDNPGVDNPGVRNPGVDAPPSAGRNGGVETRPDRSYRATEPPAGRAVPRDGKLADKIITILLLAVGAYGALSFAFSLQQLTQQLRLVGTMLGLENLSVPGTVGTVGVVGAIIVLAIYAVNVIFSIQRMRARKFAFWIPLVAFALALAVVFICTMTAVAQTPELLQQMSDPTAVDRLLNSMATTAP